MSGFLLKLQVVSDQPRSAGNRTFEARRLPLVAHVRRARFELWLYDSLVHRRSCLVELENGDLVACTGTLIYRNFSGAAALRAIGEDIKAGLDIDEHLLGQYCLIVFQAGRLTLRNDLLGYFRVYHDTEGQVYSNAFMAVKETRPDCTVSVQELAEYIGHGFFFHRTTFLQEIKILERGVVHQLLPGAKKVQRTPPAFESVAGLAFDAAVDVVFANLQRHWRRLGGGFSSFATALSGGYDSRLMVALLHDAALESYMYVYGSDSAPDVVHAKQIALGEGLDLHHTDKGDYGEPALAEWKQELEFQLHFYDGPKADGLFDNGADFATRCQRARAAEVQLNGAGGEIYRNVWDIGERTVSVQEFVRRHYELPSYEFIRSSAKSREILSRLEEKIGEILDTEYRQLTRVQVDMLFPSLRNHFGAANVGINNQMGPALLPYVEPHLVYQSFEIPMAYKLDGRFQSALMQRAYPAIAAYESSYGYRFDHGPSRKQRLAAERRRAMPTSHLRVRKRMHRAELSVPRLLNEPYLSAVFGKRELAIGEFINVGLIRDPWQLARAYTVELVLRSA